MGSTQTQNNAGRFRFGTFELDAASGELRRSGIRVRLQDQPFKILVILLERPGEVVTRDELKQRLWTDAEFGDFDQGINAAIKKIRTALGDDSANPRFVETLARRGYRFIAPVNADRVVAVQQEPAATPVAATPEVLPIASSSTKNKWRSIAILLVAALVATALLMWRRPREYSLGVFGRRSEFRIAPMTSSMGYEFAPQFSPNGQQIAYVWGAGKGQPPNIYVKVLGAGNPVPLMPADPNVWRLMPAWSPDGRFIACLRGVRPREIDSASTADPKDKSSVAERLIKRRALLKPESAIYLIPAVGGEEKKLFDVRFVTDLLWAPDGKWFLIATRDKDSDPISLWRYSLDGTQRQKLTNPPLGFNGDTIPTFSPDGKWIAFSRNYTSGGSDIFIMPTQGGEPKRITQDAHHLRGITFTADGRQIIFSSARQAGARRSLWRVSISGGKPERLSFGADNADSPVASRMGNHLAFVQQNESSTIWQYKFPEKGQKLEEPVPLINSRQLQVGAQYSPDGTRIVFASDRTGSWELWVCAEDGSNPKQLTSFGDRQTGTPRWSPDGKLIVFDARPELHSDIFVMDSEGGKPRRLTAGDHDSVVPSFSRDGQWIYYSSNISGSWELWKRRVQGADSPVQITHNGGFAGWESFDGNTLYYAKWDQPGIYSMPVHGGPEIMVTPDLFPRLWGAWQLVSDGIYLVRPAQKPDSKEIYPVLAFYSFATKETRDLFELKDAPHPGPSLAISPDRTKLLYAQPNDGGSDIMIVDNFR